MLRLKLSETDVPSRISTIFYVGLEGLGGVDLDTEENENVCIIWFSHTTTQNSFALQGIDGPILYSGSTPELDEFTIRIVDGKCSLSAFEGRPTDINSRASKQHGHSGQSRESFP